MKKNRIGNVMGACCLAVWGFFSVSAQQPSKGPLFVENGITAHRGASLAEPENSLRAFAAGIAAGADWIETDVYRTADGQLVLIHNPDTWSYCATTLKIEESTYAALRELDLAEKFRAKRGLTLASCPPHRIVRLEEAIALILKERKARLSIQPKSDCVDQAMAVVRAKGALDWVGFNDGSLAKMRRVKELAPSVIVFWDRYRSNLNRDIEIAKRHGFEWLVLNRGDLTRANVEKLQAAGFKVGVWTVNRPDDMKRCLEMGVTRLYTDDPAALKRVMEKR
jgi:glycerophosphoryl diester phosphodiesterase